MQFEYRSDGLEARRRIYDAYSKPTADENRFRDTLLLHYMAPNNPQLTRALGRRDLWSESGSENEDGSDDGSKSDISRDSFMDQDLFSPSTPHGEDAETVPYTFSSDYGEPERHRLRSSADPQLEQNHLEFSDHKMPESIPLQSFGYKRLPKTRLGLPITITVQGISATVLACADTGAEINIISNDLAQKLGFSIYEGSADPRRLALANGKVVETLGYIETTCTFGVETSITNSMDCIFHVLPKVASSIIMGIEFLQETKTLTQYRHRLIRVPRTALQALSVCSVGQPRRILVCEMNRTDTFATPDSGSEIDLISPAFVSQRSLDIHPGGLLIEFADGSTAETSGFVRTKLSVIPWLTVVPEIHVKQTVIVDFHLLEGLKHDLIVGEYTLDELKVFTDNQHVLIPADETHGPLGLNLIRYLGVVDKLRLWIKSKIGKEKALYQDSSK
jgi:hypothetical protein